MRKVKQADILKGLILFLMIFGIVYSSRYLASDYEIIINKKNYSPTTSLSDSSKNEISLIYIGSSTCIYCNNPELNSSLVSLKNDLEKISRSTNSSLNIIGYSKEYDAFAGIKHLSSLDIDFDEISSGNRWRNVSLTRYVDEFESVYSTPQVLIVKRVYLDSLSSNKVWNPLKKETILARYVGLDKISDIELSKISF